MSDNADDVALRRLHIAQQLLAGVAPAQVAIEAGMTLQTVYAYRRLLDSGGIDALRALSGRGRPSRLSESQREWLASALRMHPSHYGLTAERWTRILLSKLIWQRFGVHYSKSHIARILREMGRSDVEPLDSD